MVDAYNEYDARRYFNEFIDIVCRHKNRPDLVGRFDELINTNAINNGDYQNPLDDINFELNEPFVDFHSLKLFYVLCYFNGRAGIYNLSNLQHNFIIAYTNFIKTEYSNGGHVINYEIFVDFADNFQSLFNAIYKKTPEYDLPTFFTNFNEDYQIGENPNPGLHNFKNASAVGENMYGGNISKNRRRKNISRRCNKNKRKKSKTVKRFKKNVAGVKNKRKNNN